MCKRRLDKDRANVCGGDYVKALVLGATGYRRLDAGGAIIEQLQAKPRVVCGRAAGLCTCSSPAESANEAAANWSCPRSSNPNGKSRLLRSRWKFLAKQTGGSTAALAADGCDVVRNHWLHRDKLGGGPLRGRELGPTRRPPTGSAIAVAIQMVSRGGCGLGGSFLLNRLLARPLPWRPTVAM
jgi:hypothetical protein